MSLESVRLSSVTMQIGAPVLILASMVSATPPAHAQSGWSGGYSGSMSGYSRLGRRTRADRRARLRARKAREAAKALNTGWARPKGASDVAQIVVSLDAQRLTVYENGKAIARSSISSGKRGHDTPRGIFSIIQKRRFHRSNIYSGAPMPFMQRITWSGIALHQGQLPGYRASHGCIRLPLSFARDLFSYTRRRTHVVVAEGNPVPQPIEHALLFGPANPLSQNGPAAGRASSINASEPVRMASNRARDGSVMNDARDDAEPAEDIAAISAADGVELLAHRQLQYLSRSKGPLRILITRLRFRDLVYHVQGQLLALGHDVGTPDGQFGTMTIGAIKSFQTALGRRPTGAITSQLLDDLYEASGIAPPPAAKLHVRQDGEEIYAAPVELRNHEDPLGIHLYTLIDTGNDIGNAPGPAVSDNVSVAGSSAEPVVVETTASRRDPQWTALTLQARGRLPQWSRKEWQEARTTVAPVTAAAALDRVTIPAHARTWIEDRLTPGSSLIISDGGTERETGEDTDFIVLAD